MPNPSHKTRFRGRTLSRAQALQVLFQAEACGRAVADVVGTDCLVSDGPVTPYACELALGVADHEAELDAVLDHLSSRWSVGRMARVDRNLLRLGLYELLFEEDDELTEATVIDEAVRLARAFGLDDSYVFVNGILGRVVRDRAAGIDLVAEATRARAQDEARDDGDRDDSGQDDGDGDGSDQGDPEKADGDGIDPRELEADLAVAAELSEAILETPESAADDAEVDDVHVVGEGTDHGLQG